MLHDVLYVFCSCYLFIHFLCGTSDPIHVVAFTLSPIIEAKNAPTTSLRRLVTLCKNRHNNGSNSNYISMSKQEINDKQKKQLKNRLIFLIDDEESIRNAVGKFLISRDYNVITFENGESVLQSLDRIAQKLQSNIEDSNDYSILLPDIIVSDVRMPGGMDGLELLQSLRSSVLLMNIPVILLTAKGMTKDRIEGYNSGADAYIPKPFDPEELVTIVENLIKQRDIVNVVATKTSNNVNVKDMKRDLDEIKLLLLEQGGGGTGNGWIERGSNVYLTPNEKRVLNLLCEGYMNKEMAKQVSVSTRRIEQILTGLFRKTDTKNRTELVRWAISTGQVQL